MSLVGAALKDTNSNLESVGKSIRGAGSPATMTRKALSVWANSERSLADSMRERKSDSAAVSVALAAIANVNVVRPVVADPAESACVADVPILDLNQRDIAPPGMHSPWQ